ncbi:MAG TPA: MDR family MFS transporter [Ktedonobacteraceae bacterium]
MAKKNATARTVAEVEPLPSQAREGRRLHGKALVSVLAALLFTLLLEALDQTIVSTAMPRIIGSLQGFDRYTWVVTAYILAATSMVPIAGKLSDQFGRKWFLISGAVIFLLGSMLSGLAQNMNELIIFRTIQGLGAGTGIALVPAVVGDIFPPEERARWQGLFGMVYGISNLIGPTTGGWLTDHGPLLGNLVLDTTRWRWVFYINLPIGIIALAALLAFLPANISDRDTNYRGWAAVRRIDFLGAFLAAGATICLLLGLTWGGGQTYAWVSPQIIGVLITSVVLYACFFIVERFAAEPILPLELFRNRIFAVASLLSLLQMMILLGMALYMPFFLQGVLGQSATNSGLTTTWQSFSAVVGAMLAGMLAAFLKRYQIITIVASVIMAIGIFMLTRMDGSTSLLVIISALVIAGLGLGSFFSILSLAAQNSLPRKRLGVGTAAVRYMAEVGAILGIAIVGSVVNSTVASDIATRVPASVVRQLTPAGWKAATNPQILTNPDARNILVHTAQNLATSHVPAGPQHNLIVQQIAQQVAHTLDLVFSALRLSLVVAIQHGLFTVLIFALIMVVGTFFLKDVSVRAEKENKENDAEEPSDPVAIESTQ